MSKWIDINIEKPYNNEPVYYYFSVFDKVYYGYYCSEDESEIYGYSYGKCKTDYFYGRCGWLGDDVQYWMPREDTEGIIYPTKPIKEIL